MGIDLRALSLQPFLELRGAVGVGKPGQFAGALRGLFPVLLVALDGARHQHGIDHDTYGVYPEEIDGLKRDYEKLWGEVSKVLRELSELVAK